MSTQEEVHDVDSRLAVLSSSVDRLTSELEKVTTELRRTVDAMNAQQTEARVVRERLERLTGEVWDKDNASRIRTLELHIKGLYGLVGFLCLTVAGRLAPTIFHFIASGK
jgi:chromosome segregation ATPase